MRDSLRHALHLSIGSPRFDFQAITEDFKTALIRERDQHHCLFNNPWSMPTEPMPHEVLETAHSIDWRTGQTRFLACICWSWPSWSHTWAHGWHSIYHGLDTAAGINSDTRFPFPISQYCSLSQDIPNVTITADGKWGLGYDMFLFKQQPYTLANVQAEIFILQKKQNYGTPTILGSMTSCGKTYNYGTWPADHPLHIFWRTDDPAVPYRQQIEIYDFFNYLKARGMIQSSNILSGLYFGVEPIEGSGIFSIDSFLTNLSGIPAPDPTVTVDHDPPIYHGNTNISYSGSGFTPNNSSTPYLDIWPGLTYPTNSQGQTSGAIYINPNMANTTRPFKVRDNSTGRWSNVINIQIIP